MNRTDAIRQIRTALDLGTVLHMVDVNDRPITAGAIPGGRWAVYTYAPPGSGVGGAPLKEETFARPADMARALCVDYVGNYVAHTAATTAIDRAGGPAPKPAKAAPYVQPWSAINGVIGPIYFDAYGIPRHGKVGR